MSKYGEPYRAVADSGAGDASSGIHGSHFGPDVRIRYAASDPKRQTIPWVERKNVRAGTVKTYFAPVQSPRTSRSFRNTICNVWTATTGRHTRSSFRNAQSIAPWPRVRFRNSALHQETRFELLNQQYSIAKRPRKNRRWREAVLPSKHPSILPERTAEIERAAKALSAIYAQNVFPDLKVTWGTYPNNLGHTDFPGCFRCHDESHTAADGKTDHTRLQLLPRDARR